MRKQLDTDRINSEMQRRLIAGAVKRGNGWFQPSTNRHWRWSVYPLFLSLALVFMVGCQVEQPTNAEVAAPAWAENAITISLAEWSAIFDLPADRRFQAPPTIKWFEGPCLIYANEPADAPCSDGSTNYNPFETEVHLVRFEEPNINLPHELLHYIYLEQWDGDPDDDHTRPEWAFEEDILLAMEE